jgi:hypothetical protein
VITIWNYPIEENCETYFYSYVEELGMIKEISLITLVALGIGALFLGTSLAPAFAQSQTSSTANDYGQSASLLAKGESPVLPNVQMGQHAKAGGDAGNPPYNSDGQPGRIGIGNEGQALCGEKLTPGQLAGYFNTGNCP